MIQNNEVVSYLTIYILVSADEKEELKQKCKEVENEVQHQKLKIRNLTNYLQFDGLPHLLHIIQRYRPHRQH